MKSIYIRNLYLEILKRKKLISLSVILFMILLGLGGLRKYMSFPESYTEKEQVKVDEYEENVKEFDDAIRELSESIKVAEQQLKMTEEYCENSIYMQLDSQKIYISSVQYGIQTVSAVGNILSACVSYINDGSLKEEIADEIGDIPVEYLKEIITCTSSNNVLIISVMHYDEQAAETIIKAIEKQLQKQAAQIARVQGEFTLVELDSSSYTKADVAVMNTQNTNLNTYKNNQTTVSNLRKSLIDQRNNRRGYIDNNKPEDPSSGKSITIIFKYLLFGIILGIGAPFSIVCLKYVISDRIKSAKELSASGMTILGIYKSSDEIREKSERDVMDIRILADEKSSDMLCINVLGDSSDLAQSAETFAEQLENEEIRTFQISSAGQNVNELKKMMETKNCILMAEVGNTTYTQLEETIQLCRKFNIDIWGCVVVE